MLEQGFAILFLEEYLPTSFLVKSKLFDVTKMLDLKLKREKNQLQDYLNTANLHSRKAFIAVTDAINAGENDYMLRRFAQGKELIKQGLQMLENCEAADNESYWIWQFYYGKCLTKLDNRLRYCETNSLKEGDASCDGILIFLEIIDKFKNEKQMQLYVSRSYAYIGEILIRRKELVKGLLDQKRPDQLLETLFHNPLLCFGDESLDWKTKKKEGTCLHHLSKGKENPEKLELLMRSEEALSKSIELMSETNWGAYSQRMWVRYEIGIQTPYNENKLKNALKDGRKCFQLRLTGVNSSKFAEICQVLSKYPAVNLSKYSNMGRNTVKNSSYLYEAIFALKVGLEKADGFRNYHIALRMSSCLYDMEEYRSAVDWMKHALLLSEKSKSGESFRLVCLFLCHLYSETLKEPSSNNSQYILEELLFSFQHVIKKSGKEVIDKNIENICFHKNREMVQFLQFLINSKYVLKKNNQDIAEKIAKQLKSNKNLDFMRLGIERRLNEICDNNLEVDVKGIDINDLFESPPAPLPKNEERTRNSKEFSYDFFISHSHEDNGWVKTNLLRQLEISFLDQQETLRGCIADRDFTPGKSIVNNIVDSIKASCKVILVLSENFVKSEWCQYETDQSLIHSFTEKTNDSLIPVLIEQCEIPDKIKHLTYLDLTNDEAVVSELPKLRRALLS